mgnify:CR=1 FL=1
MEKGLFIVISGCSGVGKGTVLKRVFERMPNLSFSVSATTRKAREGEIDGVNYHFLGKEDFENRLINGEFLEHVKLFDNYYGTLNSEIDSKLGTGKDVVLEIDTEGAYNVKRKREDSVAIFILPPTVKAITERLEGRGTETKEALRLRHAKIGEEIERAAAYDYLVVNDDVEDCANQIISIITAEKLKTARNKYKIEKLRGEI